MLVFFTHVKLPLLVIPCVLLCFSSLLCPPAQGGRGEGGSKVGGGRVGGVRVVVRLVE